MPKYIFKPYLPVFSKLFVNEKKRIISAIDLSEAPIVEHVGSTAVPNLGGKGIIDISINADKKDFDYVARTLRSLGYEYRPDWSTNDRWYFKTELPDEIEGMRRYHVHLITKDSNEWDNFIKFRDYLRKHPEAVKEYSELKKNAVEDAHGDGEKYRKATTYD